MEPLGCTENLPCNGNKLTERLCELAKAVKEIEENRISLVELSNWVGFFWGKTEKGGECLKIGSGKPARD